MTIELTGFFHPTEIEALFDHIDIRLYDFDEDGYGKIIVRTPNLRSLAENINLFYQENYPK